MTFPHEPASAAGLVAAGAVALTFLLVLGLALSARKADTDCPERLDSDGDGTPDVRMKNGECKPHAQLVKRHLMYGAKSGARADLTLGSLMAVSYMTEMQRDFGIWCPPAGLGTMRFSMDDFVNVGETGDD